ncbi:uL22 family ribosomal protein [Candidatus Vidania fulgoroideorum]
MIINKRLNISQKKINIYFRYFNKLKIYNILKFLKLSNNKISILIRKILKPIINKYKYSYIKNKTLNIYANNSIRIKKRNIRAKGKMDFFTKRYSNIFILFDE